MKQKYYGAADASLYGKGLWRSLVAAGSACALVATMAAPALAFAADQLSIAEGKDKGSYGQYSEAANGNGWAWDGAEELALENYDGLYITATGGNLNITASGANDILGVNVNGGDLSIQGTDENASLSVGRSDSVTTGITASGDVDISNIDLNVDSKFDASSAIDYSNYVPSADNTKGSS